jgi:hypothetical protein
MNFQDFIVKINVKSKINQFNKDINNFNLESSSGTGFFIKDDLVLTCYHVIENAIKIEIIFKQFISKNAIIKMMNRDDDLAIIKILNIDDIKNEIKYFEWDIINNINKLEEVFAVGFPLSSRTIKISKGIISGFQDSLFQIDASLNPGNSGGPLLYIDTFKNYKVIGVNVSKLSNAENIGYAIPIYRFKIIYKWMKNKETTNLYSCNKELTYINKPIFYFNIQKIIQPELQKYIFKNNTLKNGIRICFINNKYYISKYIKENDILLKINDIEIDITGFIKLDFTPEKISILDIGYWFMPDDIIKFDIYDPLTDIIRTEYIKLKIIKKNITNDIAIISDINKFNITNNGLIFSIITAEHIKNFNRLFNGMVVTTINILYNNILQHDIFTIYLSDVINKNNDFIKYPINEIIIELNDLTFDDYKSFINICNNNIITKLKTINNEIFFI